MSPLKDVLRKYLPGRDEQSEAAALSERSLLATVESDSLNNIVQSALEFRRQGRIDRSIALVTKANRTQLDAIEAIQGGIDRLRGQGERQVVFAKFRQFYPFEMGIENGDDVLALLDDYAVLGAADSGRRRMKLHELEAQRQAERERLEFFERRFADGGEDQTIAEIRDAIRAAEDQLLSLKCRIFEDVLRSVEALLVRFNDVADRDRLVLSFSTSLYILATSPTATRPAQDVRTEA